LSRTSPRKATNPWWGAGKAVLVIAAVIFGGRHLLRLVL
jgi:hypothetical protein